MAWKEVNKMEQRKQFILRHLNGESMASLCKEYEISRKTGYKFLARFNKNGFEGLMDLSKKPLRSPYKTHEFLEELIIQVKERYITWGPKKLKIKLEELYPRINFPSASTIGYILSKKGLTLKKHRRIKRAYYTEKLTSSKSPNDIWSIDFKGHFKTQDNKYCYPLTISDHYSRYIIACEALEKTSTEYVMPVLIDCFKTYGMPKIIRSDNGSPFASVNAIFGLTKFSSWLISLGIKIERIEPGHPEQNGRHERMHRTLKEETLRPPSKNILAQQEKFDIFVDVFNKQRPHEAIGQKTPSSLYCKSKLKYEPNKTFNYTGYDLIRKVTTNGCIRITTNKKNGIMISESLTGLFLGLKELDNEWLVSFDKYDIGYIDKNTLKFNSLEFLEA